MEQVPIRIRTINFPDPAAPPGTTAWWPWWGARFVSAIPDIKSSALHRSSRRPRPARPKSHIASGLSYSPTPLRAIAEIVHAIDLQDGRSTRPETAGVDAILEGWWRIGLPDAEMETREIALFDALSGTLALSLGHSPGES